MGVLGPKNKSKDENLKNKNCLKDLEIGKLFKEIRILKKKFENYECEKSIKKIEQG